MRLSIHSRFMPRERMVTDMYTKDEVISYVEEENVKFIRLSFCDTTGAQKCITIMPTELRRAFDEGISFDASAIAGYSDIVQSDLLLRPDPSTLSSVPWHPTHGRMVRMYCSIHYPDGRQFPRDGRYILKTAVDEAAAAGISFYFGSEFEFYLFKTDENGERTTIPFDHAGYMDIDPGDKCEQIRREICFTLSDMGIQPESAHHEEGPGQNEITFRFSDPLKAADDAITFKSVVRTIASRNGLYANFSPKPLPGESGNGFHINMSVQDNSRGSDVDYTGSVIAGLLEHITEMTAFLNPTEKSYERLGSHKAPRYVSWSPENRSQLIRIPGTPSEYRNGYRLKRIELRSPDPSANPYIAYTLLIRAGLDGIKRNLTPPPPLNINLYEADNTILQSIRKLPATLEEAKNIAKQSAWIRSVLPDGMLN